ncbi:hypothetical protein GGR57DRAFT_517135 [Xylariaceae sp. FL1272]|nr:hypothetical protein GGR57DRAFT_517135 [Xylariaceae sp. FL1272]
MGGGTASADGAKKVTTDAKLTPLQEVSRMRRLMAASHPNLHACHQAGAQEGIDVIDFALVATKSGEDLIMADGGSRDFSEGAPSLQNEDTMVIDTVQITTTTSASPQKEDTMATDTVVTTATTSSSTEEQPEPSFQWGKCEDLHDEERIFVKEEALRFGIEQCRKLVNQLEGLQAQIAGIDDPYARTIWAPNSLNKLISECKRIIADHEDFSVLVGVKGATGAGKTSLLNAVLGYRELLPSNNEEAATAVPCTVAYNTDDKPGNRFRCEIIFRGKKSLKDQLSGFFKELEELSELKGKSHFDRTADDEVAIRNFKAHLKPSYEMIKVLFDIDESDVQNMDLQSILRTNPYVLKLCGTKRPLHSDDAEEFANKVKPYLDSTVSEHGESKIPFATWPLVDKVRIFVKSPILKNGVVLVDLPGVADAVESRALVAEQFFKNLEATIIVAPVARAASTNINTELMTKHAEMEIMKSGKFRSDFFCVCVTQIDSIDRTPALKKKTAKQNEKIQHYLLEEASLKDKRDEMRQKIKEVDKTVKQLHKKAKDEYKKTKQYENSTGANKRKYEAAVARYDEESAKLAADLKRSEKLNKRIKKINKDLNIVTDKIMFFCIKERNSLLEGKIQGVFADSQSALKGDDDNLSRIYDGKASICYTSAKAFWQCVNGEEQLAGFPDELYTGIPNLRTWIRKATIVKREEHTDAMLNRLYSQQHIARLWAADESGRIKIEMSRDEFEREFLQGALEDIEQNMGAFWDKLGGMVSAKNPMSEENAAFGQCALECSKAVNRWTFQRPDDEESQDLVHWQTYKANITRGGSSWKSKTGRNLQEHHWMKDISLVFEQTIIRPWNKSLNHDIPDLAKPASSDIDKIWDTFVKRLGVAVGAYNEAMLASLEAEMPALDLLKTKMYNDLRSVLGGISKSARKADIAGIVQKQWQPAFRRAQKINGTHSHRLRQEELNNFAKYGSEKVFTATFEKTQKYMDEVFQALPKQFASISTSAMETCRQHISALLDKVVEPEGDPVKLEHLDKLKAEMQRSVKEILVEWEMKWKFPDVTFKTFDANAPKIPEDYQESKVKHERRDGTSTKSPDVEMEDAHGSEKTETKTKKGRPKVKKEKSRRIKTETE